MSKSTRRGFLKVAGVSAAAVGVGAAAAPSADAAVRGRATVPSHASGALVAHVADVRGDSVTLFVGEREVVVRDADLVARLAHAAH